MGRATEVVEQSLNKGTVSVGASGPGNQMGTTSSNSKVMCYRYRESGHETKFCTAKITCLVCGNESHMTEFCTLPKQPKPVAKFVGHAAKGLGCLLVQNAKMQSNKEHVNPLAVISVTVGQLDEGGVIKGFSEMFEWNWVWKAKRQRDNLFVMRFPSKQKITELQKFGEFTLLGTGCKVQVKTWTHDVTAKGKLHLVWIRLTGLPDPMKNWKGYAEICSTLGVFKSLDIEGLKDTGVVRCQVGVRDPARIPQYTETTTEDMMIYEVGVHLEGVIEPGWYNAYDTGKRIVREDERANEGNRENDMGAKKSRNSEGVDSINIEKEGHHAGGSARNVTLDNLSEEQIQ